MRRSPNTPHPRAVRRSQALRPYGVGAIWDRGEGSFVACDIGHWGRAEILHEPRLAAQLGVESFRMLTLDEEAGQRPVLPFCRFPRWMFCGECHRMVYWERSVPGAEPICCGQPLVPMRLVMACPNGHLADVPWHDWLHLSTDKRGCRVMDLEYLFVPPEGVAPLGASTNPVFADGGYVHCRNPECHALQAVADLSLPVALARLGIRCTGSQPWEKSRPGQCDAVPMAVPRGASNVHFPVMLSAIDIPPYSDHDAPAKASTSSTTDPELLNLVPHLDTPAFNLQARRKAKALNMTVAELRDLLLTLITEAPQEPVAQPMVALPGGEAQALKQVEYKAFLAPGPVHPHPRNDFIKAEEDWDAYLSRVTTSEFDPVYRALVAEIAALVPRVVRVTRLREVRVLRGFSRLASATVGLEGPPNFAVYKGQRETEYVRNAVPASFVGVDLGTDPHRPPAQGWLPADELFGEGIFLALSQERLAAWLDRAPLIQQRAALLQTRAEQSKFLPPTVVPQAGFTVLHTFAHLIMRQLSFVCGYALASIRERLYFDPMLGMAGILIYTAAGDTEGTLGGLVREGELARFAPLLLRAVRQAEACSSDPLCLDSQGQGPDSLNLAACHACTLVPESSCEFGNRLLDRLLVTGSATDPLLGYFGRLLPGVLDEVTT